MCKDVWVDITALSYTAGSDLVMVSQMLIFPMGTAVGGQECVDISIINDTNVECDDAFNVTLTTSDSNVEIADGYGVAIVTIELDTADGEDVTLNTEYILLLILI